MKLFLTRNGETEHDTVTHLFGCEHKPLTPLGCSETYNLAYKLQNAKCKIDCILSSDLAQAKETAEIISDSLHLPIKLDVRLRECDVGTCEGKILAEVRRAHQLPDNSIYVDEQCLYDFRPFGGEDWFAVEARHREALNEMRIEFVEANILCVGHSIGINTLLAARGKSIGLKRGEYRVLDLV